MSSSNKIFNAKLTGAVPVRGKITVAPGAKLFINSDSAEAALQFAQRTLASISADNQPAPITRKEATLENEVKKDKPIVRAAAPERKSQNTFVFDGYHRVDGSIEGNVVVSAGSSLFVNASAGNSYSPKPKNDLSEELMKFLARFKDKENSKIIKDLGKLTSDERNEFKNLDIPVEEIPDRPVLVNDSTYDFTTIVSTIVLQGKDPKGKPASAGDIKPAYKLQEQIDSIIASIIEKRSGLSVRIT